MIVDNVSQNHIINGNVIVTAHFQKYILNCTVTWNRYYVVCDILTLSLIHIQMCIRDRRCVYNGIKMFGVIVSLLMTREAQLTYPIYTVRFSPPFTLTSRTLRSVSYTHLDVYKRQGIGSQRKTEFRQQVSIIS